MPFIKLLRTGAAILAALSVSLTTPAAAGGICRDAPVYAPAVSAPALYVSTPLWQGFYTGGHIGGDWSDATDDRTLALFFDGVGPVPFRGGDLSGSGVFGGVQFGYNWQPSCCFVFGIEVDIGGMDTGIDKHNVFVPVAGSTFGSFGIKSNGGWYGDVTGRLGYTWGGALLYAKGGFAWLDPDLSVSETVAVNGETVFTNSGRDNGGGTLSGWTVGGGVEFKIDPRWTWKIEYMFFDFSLDDNCCFDGIRPFKFFSSDLTVNTVKVGFNYSLNALPIPLK